MVNRSSLQKLLREPGHFCVRRSFCVDGAPYSKHAAWFGTSPHLPHMEAGCACKQEHLWVQGRWLGADYRWRLASTATAVYSRQTCRAHVIALAQTFRSLRIPRAWQKPVEEKWWPTRAWAKSRILIQRARARVRTSCIKVAATKKRNANSKIIFLNQ